MLEGYFFVHKFSDKEKSSTEESEIYGANPTWDFCVDAVKEKYYPIGNYED